MTIKTKSAAETQRFGKQLAQKLAGGGVVCLFGNLGAGKTTMVQGIAKGLGVTQRIISPTFIIVRRYEIPSKPVSSIQFLASRYLWHIDLYRLGDIREIKDLGIEELWQDPENILLIEWPERVASILPKSHWEVKMATLDKNTRKIQVKFKN